MELPEDEAASIALHLLNAEYENSLGITMQVTQALGEMLQVLKHHPAVHLDRGSLYFDELIVHLKFLALDQFSPQHQPPRESDFAQLISRSFPEDFRLAGIVTQPLAQASGRALTPEQLAYLTVNLHRIHRA